MAESPEAQIAFGYLSAIESAEHGLFGGYLIVSQYGRPLEFHCTAPVLPTRAQRILYGVTLESYLLADVIGPTLLGAAHRNPNLVLTDQSGFAITGRQISSPLVLTCRNVDVSAATTTSGHSGSNEQAASNVFVSEIPAVASSWDFGFTERDSIIYVPRGNGSDVSVIQPLVRLLLEHIELFEPFDRIREAICEAQRIGSQNSEANAQAA